MLWSLSRGRSVGRDTVTETVRFWPGSGPPGWATGMFQNRRVSATSFAAPVVLLAGDRYFSSSGARAPTYQL